MLKKLVCGCFLLLAASAVGGCQYLFPEDVPESSKSKTPSSPCVPFTWDACKPQDVKECKHLADTGNIGAMFQMGELYMGDLCPEYKDGRKALIMYLKAKMAGNQEAEARIHHIYAIGLVIPKTLPPRPPQPAPAPQVTPEPPASTTPK